MEKEQRCYQAINAILSKHGKSPYKKEEIKAAIISSIREYDYITAIVAYLWGAYNNFDPNAKIAFREIFADDLKEHDQTAFYFFSFYFSRSSRSLFRGLLLRYNERSTERNGTKKTEGKENQLDSGDRVGERAFQGDP
jgi:hypothetical protein